MEGDAVSIPIPVDDGKEKGIPEYNISEIFSKEAEGEGRFPGATRILCGGQIITSAASSWLPFTVFLFFLPIVGFCIFSLSSYLKVMSLWYCLPVLVMVFFSMTTAFMTALTDPGILPRKVNPKETIKMDGSTDYGGEPLSLLVYHQSAPGILLGKEISTVGPDGQRNRIFLKYCSTCEIFRPPRCSHCSYCDNCVEEFDHHCPWLSNCIGRRNYRYFVYFIASTSVTCGMTVSLLAVTLHRIRMEASLELFDLLASQRVMTVCAIFTGSLCLALLAMTVYHMMLISKDQTTSEQVKGRQHLHSHQRSCLNNWSRIFCGPRPSRLVQWRNFVA